jgi:uncharacterized protein YbjT (DUF2867 family)
MRGDATDAADLARACAGVDVAYWLVHSMEGGVDFERADRLAAERFAAACIAGGVRRIIYLGGLGADDDRLSAHLRSRHEVGAILRASGLEVIEFRASIVIGAGSFSFDLVRTLVERLPLMICPAWLATPTPPIAIDDVVAYLSAAIDLPASGPRIFEIGGPDKVSYGAIMREYARQRGLWRVMVPEWQQSITSVRLTPGLTLSNWVRNQSSVSGFFQFRSVGHMISSRRSGSS